MRPGKLGKEEIKHLNQLISMQWTGFGWFERCLELNAALEKAEFERDLANRKVEILLEKDRNSDSFISRIIGVFKD